MRKEISTVSNGIQITFFGHRSAGKCNGRSKKLTLTKNGKGIAKIINDISNLSVADANPRACFSQKKFGEGKILPKGDCFLTEANPKVPAVIQWVPRVHGHRP